jgi:hypothetical protein
MVRPWRRDPDVGLTRASSRRRRPIRTSSSSSGSMRPASSHACLIGAHPDVRSTARTNGLGGHRPRGPGLISCSGEWSGRSDSNARPPEPHSGALPGCATPRQAASVPAGDATPGERRCRRTRPYASVRGVSRASHARASASSSFDSRASRSTRQRRTSLPSNRARWTSRAIGISTSSRSARPIAASTV